MDGTYSTRQRDRSGLATDRRRQQDLPSTLVTLTLVVPLVLESVKATVTGHGEPDGTVIVISSEADPRGTIPELGSTEATLGSLLTSQLKSSVEEESLVMTTVQTVGLPVADSHFERVSN